MEMRNRSEISTNSSTIIEKKDKVNLNQNKIEIVSSMILGIIFGYLMNKSTVHLGPIIRDQMLFKRLTMIKMFLSAVGMSMLSVVCLLMINRSKYEKVLNAFIQKTNRIDAIQLSIGGILIGIGMVLAGSCPGTIFVQIGSGLPNSFITAIGACFGVLFYYLFVQKVFVGNQLSKSSTVLKDLSSLLNINRIYLNILFGLTMISVGFLLEYLIPSGNIWSPVLCGIGIGLLQLFYMILLEKSLGISTGFSVIVGQLYRVEYLQKFLSPLKSFTWGSQNLITFLFSLGAILGSFLSSYSSNQFPLDSKYGGNILSSFFGGFLLLLGARCAGGCTSGQGISGVSHLLIGSFMATASMFAGGIFFAISYGLISNDWQFNHL